MSVELFPGADDDNEEELVIESNSGVPSGAAGPAVPSGGLSSSQPLEVTQEEIDAAEAEAQWLLNPMSMLDLTQTKERLMKLHAEGVAFQREGQYGARAPPPPHAPAPSRNAPGAPLLRTDPSPHPTSRAANARAVYTRAIGMEAPNKRSAAALYYNRSACQRQLGQLGLALRDAEKSAELDPTSVKALWRAADVALAMGDRASAQAAVTAGLKLDAKNQPLLQLKLKLVSFTEGQ